MRINLKIEDLNGVKRITQVFHVKYKRGAIIKFIIDTGCPFSQISEIDIQRMGIPITRSYHDKIASGLGGSIINLKEINKDVELLYENKLKTKVLHLAYSPSPSPKSITRVSLLGTDFLIEQRFKLVVDFSNNNTYLEREDIN